MSAETKRILSTVVLDTSLTIVRYDSGRINLVISDTYHDHEEVTVLEDEQRLELIDFLTWGLGDGE